MSRSDNVKQHHTAAERGAFHAAKLVDKAVFDALNSVFSDGAYCQKAITDALRSLSDDRSHAFVTSAFYGVLDKNVRLEKIISSLCEKAPGTAASVVLKIGLYYLGYADMPDYAAVNRAVELSKQVNGVYSGFINATLKRSVGFVPTFSSSLEKFSYDFATPVWLCKMLIADYGETRAASILGAEIPTKTHIRPIKNRITEEQFESLTRDLKRTEYGCYCDKNELKRFEEGTVIAQSLSSVRAVNAYVKGISGGKAVDLCAAPGGKSVYLTELGDFDVTACDIYPHKIELIKKLAKKTGVKIKTVLNDATVLNPDFVDAFDLVICDCPCSGTGTLKVKPDILLRRKPSDLDELNLTQNKILDVSSRYCKKGGTLCYSTCSVLKKENEKVIEAFLKTHADYSMVDSLKLLPDVDGCDGFYIARLRRE